MVYQGAGLVLQVIGDISHGESNDVLICRDNASPLGKEYTLLVLHKEQSKRKVVQVLEGAEKQAYVARFAHGESLCYVFPYRQERELSQFAPGQVTAVKQREEVAVNLVMACLSCGLPYPILALILTQNQVHLGQDNEIYFGYGLDLSLLKPEVTESQCTIACAELVINLLERDIPERKQSQSYQIIRKKRLKNAYNNLPELYRDICLTAVSGEKVGIVKKLKAWFKTHEGLFFRLLVVVCIVLIFVALTSLLSYLIFGENLWFRFFQDNFSIIGTENLNP
ncbi:hypothetical protein RFF05_09900 [Bengtsoniella intestinalis]|uniref:hypothetical protein n=1 Tax=Bengtsoniella intestinalis TaxID=3073143 RepID=UPI00391F6A28